jgi:tetratricopeptide (TPR) repeat protein
MSLQLTDEDPEAFEEALQDFAKLLECYLSAKTQEDVQVCERLEESLALKYPESLYSYDPELKIQELDKIHKCYANAKNYLDVVDCEWLLSEYNKKYSIPMSLQLLGDSEQQFEHLAKVLECALSAQTPDDMKRCEIIADEYNKLYGDVKALTSFY